MTLDQARLLEAKLLEAAAEANSEKEQTCVQLMLLGVGKLIEAKLETELAAYRSRRETALKAKEPHEPPHQKT